MRKQSQNKNLILKYVFTVAIASSKVKPYAAGPVISGQVLVQSAQEKDLLKQIRREEKRSQKLRQGYENDVEEAASMKMFQ